MIAGPSGLVQIYPVGVNTLTALTCTPYDGGRSLLLPVSAGQKQMYAMVLTAITLKKSLNIRLQDTTDTCEVQYVRYHEDS